MMHLFARESSSSDGSDGRTEEMVRHPYVNSKDQAVFDQPCLHTYTRGLRARHSSSPRFRNTAGWSAPLVGCGLEAGCWATIVHTDSLQIQRMRTHEKPTLAHDLTRELPEILGNGGPLLQEDPILLEGLLCTVHSVP